MDPAAGIVMDRASSDAGCNGCLPRGSSEVRVNMEDPENPGMILATTASTQARLYILGWLLQSIFP